MEHYGTNLRIMNFFLRSNPLLSYRNISFTETLFIFLFWSKAALAVHSDMTVRDVRGAACQDKTTEGARRVSESLFA